MARLVCVRFVELDLIRHFRAPETETIRKLLVACCNVFDRPIEEFGFYLATSKSSRWLESDDKIELIGPEEVLQFQRKSELIVLKSAGELQHYAQGALQKRDKNQKSHWDPRWFVLRGPLLSYYRKKSQREAAGTINLASEFSFGPASVDSPVGPPWRLYICIAQPHRRYELGSDSEQEVEHWLRILRTVQHSYSSGPGLAVSGPAGDSDGTDFDIEELDDYDDDSHKHHSPQRASVGDNCGFLLKRSSKTKAYKRLWFVLHDKALFYFKLPTDARPLRVVNLDGARLFDRSRPPRRFLLKIQTAANDKYHLLAPTPQVFADWLDAFEFIAGMNASPADLRASRSDSTYADSEDELDEMSQQRIEIQGFLQKQGHNMIGDWRRRWFMLRGSSLFYQKTPSSKSMLGGIPLGVATVRTTESSKRQFSFEIEVGARTYYLAAATDEERAKWLTSLHTRTESKTKLC
eukprot:Lithocolla_globosa_v1_NODE_3752_length_1591_cov_6.196615.p1 type:complete len:464 gc:universal NODE_3752_length_1591_cov_6.196615:1551-160(-)